MLLLTLGQQNYKKTRKSEKLKTDSIKIGKNAIKRKHTVSSFRNVLPKNYFGNSETENKKKQLKRAKLNEDIFFDYDKTFSCHWW